MSQAKTSSKNIEGKTVGKKSGPNSAREDFRGLTVFELIMIMAVIGGVILWAFSTRSAIRNEVYDETRKGRVTALKENLKLYMALNGTFPSQQQFDEEDSRLTLLAGYISDEGQNAFFDPQKKEELMLYYPEPEGCAATAEDPCELVSLSLQLSTGEEYFKFAVKPGTELKYFLEDGSLNSNGQLGPSSGGDELTDAELEDFLDELDDGVESVPEPGD